LPAAGLSHCWTAGVEDVEGFTTAIESWYVDLKANRTSNHRALATKRFSREVCFGAVVNRYRLCDQFQLKPILPDDSLSSVGRRVTIR
jgi:hypothetical protein